MPSSIHTRALLAFAALLAASQPASAEPVAPPSRSPSSSVPPAPDAPAPLTLTEVFATLRATHPALAASRAAAEAARSRVDQEKAWMDPRLTFEHMRDNRDFFGYSELKLGISQEIPLSGRNTLRARAAEAEAAVTVGQATRQEWLLLDQARVAFVELASADARRAVNRRLHDLIAQTAALARLSYENGYGDQAGLLALDTELARVDAECADLDGMLAGQRARLNALLLRPAGSPLVSPALPEPAPPALDVAAAVALARSASPDVAVALREADAARARLAVANKNRSVDPEIMFAARRMDDMGGDVLTSYDTGVSFSLPWLNPGRSRGEVAEARARLAMTRSDALAAEADIAGKTASAHARAVSAFEQLRRQRDEVLPLARASTAAARRDYEAGHVALVPVLAAERAEIDAEMRLVDLRAAQALAAAELAFLTSQDLAP